MLLYAEKERDFELAQKLAASSRAIEGESARAQLFFARRPGSSELRLYLTPAERDRIERELPGTTWIEPTPDDDDVATPRPIRWSRRLLVLAVFLISVGLVGRLTSLPTDLVLLPVVVWMAVSLVGDLAGWVRLRVDRRRRRRRSAELNRTRDLM